ncbi:non-ribosomal peptide synthetase [Chryseobacterium bernardetii]|uniref:non-ribosomal peptide synthetase n=1 Tax=Chryseobacterium bernardetii TaxID=1241978 RepID=UPI0016271245|nr:non-ribosomal peptide synthetase [Chryseobacterium bernardetii]
MKLTLPQQDIYFEQLLFPEQPIYNIGAKISIEGHLNYEIFEQAYTTLIQQHDAYRNYVNSDGENVEMVAVDEIRPLELIDFSNEENEEETIANFIQNEFKKTFNLEKDKFLYRFALIKIRQDYHYLFSVYHHIITDGWGTSLMFTRLVKNYNEISENGIVISQYPFAYHNFAVEDQNYFNSEDFIRDKEYWVQKFKSLPESILDKFDLSKNSNESSRKELIIPRNQYDKLNAIASETKSTTFHVILAILYIYFAKKSQLETISIGLPVLNRSGARFKKTVGLFMGVNPLVLSIDEDNTFAEVVEQVKNQLKQNYRHQRFPLGQLVKELGVFTQKERIFNITLSYEKQDYSSHFKGTVTRVVPLSHESERVALALYIREFDETEDVKIDFDYNLNYFTQESINEVVEHFRTLMEDVLKNPNQIIKKVNFLTDSERHQLLTSFNNTRTDYPKDKTIIQLFEEQVEKRPDNVAVWDSKTKITYRELKEKSDKVAQYLVSSLGENTEPVGVLVNRSAELIVILLGVLKSGKCYIPIDPMLPGERISYIIGHSKASVIITEEAQEFYPTNNKETEARFIAKEDLLQFETSDTPIHLNNKSHPSDTAYIIYTSGSTGTPKGVEIGHESLTNFLTGIQRIPGISVGDVFYSVTTYSFDISILEFFTPLISGASVFMAEKEILNNVEALQDNLAQIRPGIIQGTPSFYQMLFNSGWKGDKDLKVLCGGDRLSESLAGHLLDCCGEVWNMYGPTETTIWSSIKKIEKSSDASNIGSPIQNTQMYILDSYENLLPVNTAGRIFISGDGLAKGYYHNEVLTEDKFIHNPFSGISGSKMYETGDLGKWTVGGEIEFLGRNDFQVKIRGFRIELGEIESRLQSYPGINQVICDAKEAKGEKVLAAYYTYEDSYEELDKGLLREYLQSSLPDYMIPGFFVELSTIPLTSNGKIDRKALPDVTGEDLIRRGYVAPVTDLEVHLVKIWQDALGVETIGITDNFFELGGHSLIAGKIANIISRKLNKAVSLKHIFQHHTIESLAKKIKNLKDNITTIPKAEQKAYYPLTSDQMNMWLASQKQDFSNAYNMYSLFEIEGNINTTLFENAMNKLILDNEILRTNFIEKEGQVYQSVSQGNKFRLETVSNEENFLAWVKKYISESFDLESDPLIKVAVFNQGTGKKYLVFLTHHIIIDGISLDIILHRLIRLYHDNGETVMSDNLQFKDYTEWLYAHSHQKLSGYQNDTAKTKVLNIKNELGLVRENRFSLSLDLYHRLRRLSENNKTTLFTSVTTLLSIVINKIYQQQNICVGTIFNGRNTEQLEHAIGMFVKTLPLYLQIDESSTFASQVKNTRHQLNALEEKTETLSAYSLNELTDFLLSYQHSDILVRDQIEFSSFSLKKEKLHHTQARFPVVFNFFESDQLICDVEYSEYVDFNVIELIWDKFLLLLDWICENPHKTIKEAEISTAQEEQLKNSVDISFDF